MERLYSVPEVAARFAVTTQTVRNWIASGRLDAIQASRRGRFRVAAGALAAFERDARPARPLAGTSPARSEAGSGTTSGRVATIETGTGSKSQPRLDPGAVELARIVGAIVAAVEPESVLLFGSRARGEGGAMSDVDLAIMAPDGTPRRRLAMQAYEAVARLEGRTIAVDIVVLTPSVVEAERHVPGSLSRAVLADAVAVHGRRALA
jgi:predicted nucleotidyltransferase